MPDHAILTPEAHGELRVREDRGAELGDAVMCAVTFPDEFRRVQEDYPILFRRNAERDGFTAWAMFGFEDGENLFLEDGRWDAEYRPLAIDIQPFLIGHPENGAAAKQVHIDMASPRIGAGEGVRVFDADGRPTPYLESIAEKLGAIDIGFGGAPDFFAALERHNLLEPLTLEVTLEDGSIRTLVGFHIVNESWLQLLGGDVLGELHAAGHLMPLFMAIASVGRLNALVERKNRRLRHG
jgi:hypothetical protein